MLFQKSNLHYMTILSIIIGSFFQSDKAMADADICNEGDSWVYFATMAWNNGLRRDEALIEGFTPIEPGECASIIPYGMSRIYISLFLYDSKGNISNPVMVPENATSSQDFVKHICVQPQQAFRHFNNAAYIKNTFTSSCPKNYIQAKTSFQLKRGRNTNLTLRLNYDSSESRPVWGKTYGAKRTLQSIWDGESQGWSEHMQENAAKARDRKANLALLKAASDYIDKAKKRQDEANVRRYQVYAAKQQAFVQRVEAAKKAMEKPEDEACAPYLEKSLYDDYETLNIAGVQLGMDTLTAHRAIICNGFSIPPAVVARAGGIEKLLKQPRGVKYSKKINDKRSQEIELEIRGERLLTKPSRIISVRARFFDYAGIDDQAWEKIQDDFIEKYDLGGERRSPRFVHYKNEDAGQSFKLEPDLRRNPMSSYTISLCCGRY